MPAGRGPVGPAGVNAYSTTIGSNTQPAVGSSINVRMSSNGTWATVGQIVYVAGGGFYEVLSPLASPFVTLKNLGYTGNASPGTSIASGAQVSPAGPIGPTGATGAAGATGAGSYVDFEAFAQLVILTEGSQQWTKGWAIHATASGKTCTGARVRITSAANQTYKIAIWNGSTLALIDSVNVSHTAGTSSHTVTWSSPVSMTAGLVYYVTMYCTTAAKDCLLVYSSAALHGPMVPSNGQRLQIAADVWIDRFRVNAAGDACPNSDNSSDQALPLSPIIA